MEILFVITHTVMIICLLGVVCASIPGTTDNDQIEKPYLILALLTKVKPIQINTGWIARTVTALLTIFLR